VLNGALLRVVVSGIATRFVEGEHGVMVMRKVEVMSGGVIWRRKSQCARKLSARDSRTALSLFLLLLCRDRMMTGFVCPLADVWRKASQPATRSQVRQKYARS
jgi:predicted aminopeptidase